MSALQLSAAALASLVAALDEATARTSAATQAAGTALRRASDLGAGATAAHTQEVADDLQRLGADLEREHRVARDVLTRVHRLLGQEPGTSRPSAGIARSAPAAVPDVPRRPPAVRPAVADGRLGNLVENLYKGADGENRVGDGTTMDAIRNERLTGRPTGGRFHRTKGRETLRGLENWLRRTTDADESDRSAAERLVRQLRDALGDG